MMNRMIFSILVVFTLWGHSKSSVAPESHEDHILVNLKPELYDLEIFTDLMNTEPRFWGTVRIMV